jgi:hypothetical protein
VFLDKLKVQSTIVLLIFFLDVIDEFSLKLFEDVENEFRDFGFLDFEIDLG